MSPERIAALIERFQNEEIWTEIIEPYLVDEQDKAKEACLWSPEIGSGKALSVDDLALRTAYYSGGAAVIERLAMHLQGLIRDGKESSQDAENIDKGSQSKA